MNYVLLAVAVIAASLAAASPVRAASAASLFARVTNESPARFSEYKGNYSLYGNVSDRGTKFALKGVSVQLMQYQEKTKKWKQVNRSTSDKNGNYGFAKLDAKQTYAVRVTKKGYESYEYRNVVPFSKTATLDIKLIAK